MDPREKIVQFISEFTGQRGYSPSVREIAAACGISSTSVVTYHLERLEQAGRVSRVPDIPRSVRVVA